MTSHWFSCIWNHMYTRGILSQWRRPIFPQVNLLRASRSFLKAEFQVPITITDMRQDLSNSGTTAVELLPQTSRHITINIQTTESIHACNVCRVSDCEILLFPKISDPHSLSISVCKFLKIIQKLSFCWFLKYVKAHRGCNKRWDVNILIGK